MASKTVIRPIQVNRFLFKNIQDFSPAVGLRVYRERGGGGGGRAGHFTGVAALVAAWLGISLAWSTYKMHLGMKQRFKRCATVMPNSIHKL